MVKFLLNFILLIGSSLVPTSFGLVQMSAGESSLCEANEAYYEGICYDFVNATSPISYATAQDLCKARGKTLAKITSAGLQSFLANSAEMRAWSRALFGLRLTRDKWMWAKDGSLLYGQGCYIDNTERRDLNISTQFMYSLKPPDCVDYCRTQPTARFVGIQAGRQCFCGADYGTLPPTINCNTPCGGDPNLFCGGQGANYIYAIDGAYSAWEDSRPANEGGCAAMVLGNRALFPWRDVQCSSRIAHICQFDEYRDISEVSAYFCLYTTCYVLYDQQKPWYAARAHCQMLGGDLAKIDTTKVHSEIVAMLADHHYLGLVWIGASSGKWIWSDGTNVGDYTAWSNYNTQPIVESAFGTCAELSSSETNYNWVTRDCGQLTGKTTFICQKPSRAGVEAVPRSSNLNNLEGYSSAVVYEPQNQKNSVVYDPQNQKNSNSQGVAYGVAWYGWLLIGLMIGLVMCIVTFTLVWFFCLRKSARSVKLGSSIGSRSHSAVTKPTHICHRHHEGATSSGIGSSVNSTSSSSKQSESKRTVDETTLMETRASEQSRSHVRACGHEYRDVVTVTMAPGSAGRMRVNSGYRSSSETRALPGLERETAALEILSGRRRLRKRADTRVGPMTGDDLNDDGDTPRDPFSVTQDERV